LACGYYAAQGINAIGGGNRDLMGSVCRKGDVGSCFRGAAVADVSGGVSHTHTIGGERRNLKGDFENFCVV
jgi:hypothetical protein